MNILYTVFQSIIQGLTEFLPVSSSGHLVIFQQFLKIKQPNLLIDLTLHSGTFVAIIIFFRKKIFDIIYGFFKKPFDLSNYETDYVLKIITVSIPTGIMGLLIYKFSEVFESVFVVIIGFFLTGILLIVAEKISKKFNNYKILPSFSQAFIIGLFQGIAVLPGFSRSGWTISAALLVGLSASQATEFSFITGIVPLFFALLLEFLSIKNIDLNLGFNLIVGFSVSFIVGIVAIKVLLEFIRRYKLWLFGIYLFTIAFISCILWIITRNL